MTNEQTALLLKMIADRAWLLAGDVERLVESGEHEMVSCWIGEGPMPAPPIFAEWISALGSKTVLPYEDERNWEMRPEGRRLSVIAVEEFAQWLDSLADDLGGAVEEKEE